MKTKIIGILVCMLLIYTVFSVSGQVCVEKTIKNFGKTSFGDDVPTWETGYSWTYSGESHIIDEDFTLDIELKEVCFYVVNNGKR